MPRLALLLISFVVILLANFGCAGLLEYPTHGKIINENQASTHSSLQPQDDEAFWQELGDLFSPEDALWSDEPPLQNFPHQPHYIMSKTTEYTSTQSHENELGVQQAPKAQPLGLPNSISSFETQLKTVKPETLSIHETGNCKTQLSKKKDESRIQVFEPREESMSEDEPRGGERQHENNLELLRKPKKAKNTKLLDTPRYTKKHKSLRPKLFKFKDIKKKKRLLDMHTIYKLAGEKNVGTFRTELHQFVLELKQNGYQKRKRGLSAITKSSRNLLSLVFKSSLLQISLYAQIQMKVEEALLGKIQKKAFTFLKGFWTMALAKNEDKTIPYYHVYQADHVKSCLTRAKRLLLNRGAAEGRSEAAAWRATEAFVYFYWKISFHRLQGSSVTKKLESSGGAEYNMKTSLFLKSQAYNEQFWPEDKTSPIDIATLAHLCRESYRHSILFYSKILAQGEFDRLHLSLNGFLKSIWNRYDERLDIFIETAIDDIINRICYIIKSSFLKLQVYYSLGFGGRLKLNFAGGFEAKAFGLLEYFCEMALFGEVEGKIRDTGMEEKFNTNGILENSRISLSIDAENEAVGEWISWHATEFFVSWFWHRELAAYQKDRITERIDSVGKEKNIAALYDPKSDEELEAIYGQISQKGSRNLIDRYSRKLGEAGLKHYKYNMDKPRQTILDRRKELIAPLRLEACSVISRRIAYLMKVSFVKIQVFASFKMGDLPKADFVDGYEEKAIQLLTKFWLLTLFGKPDSEGQDLAKEKSMRLDEVLQDARRILDLSTTDDRIRSVSWNNSILPNNDPNQKARYPIWLRPWIHCSNMTK
ncbi:hypothetical protein O181_001730 [Austropuccinia psidii MF-1]|uniref:Uncharacterized protein n=1 Tax=Austropuccinia psidii MF-1 TaxID=1389203 RepID=A0A9Q3BBL4_9BASI|nr:hypothetical protein [Austropuccinia psidii MF-1]